MAIDIGSGTGNYDNNNGANITYVDVANPANATGYLDVFKVWANTNLTGLKAGTFSGTPNTFAVRDYETIGSVTAGSEQTFTGKNCDVVTGDFIGSLQTAGGIEYGTGGTNSYYSEADRFTGGSFGYNLQAGYRLALYATGVESGWTHISKVNGATASTLSKINGIAVGGISKINGVAV